nr:uncharacterized protein LOC113739671 [Coffea arabica]
MTKAYDRMSWVHITSVLRKFGFGERFIDIVWRLLANVWFSVIINGASHGFFKSSRGLRQGDPLSPVLFVIGAETLSRGLNNLAQQKGYLGFRVSRACPRVTHLAFADDVMIFTNGATAGLKGVMHVLGAYQQSSGQLVNTQKSGYLVHPSLTPSRRRVFVHGGKVNLDSACAFVCSGPPALGCGVTCFAFQIGGKGVRELPMGCFGRRHEFRAGSSLWASFMRAKYCRDLHPCEVELSRHDSGTWRRMATVAPTLSFTDFIVNGKWSSSLLSLALPPDLVPSVVSLPIPYGGRADEPIWRLTSSGEFSVASAFEEVRQARCPSFVHSHLWHPRIPLKISLFMLRLLLGRLPLPDVLCKMGFQMRPSKCWCCPEGACETVEHAFSEGQAAKEVWSYFTGLCDIMYGGSSLRARVVAWWMSSPCSAYRRLIFRLLPSFICWHIWRARNASMFEGVRMHSKTIC